MSYPSDIDHIVHEILSDMSLKEKAAIANMGEDEVPYLQYHGNSGTGHANLSG